MFSFIVHFSSCKIRFSSAFLSILLPHIAAKEMAILLNLQHAKDDIKLYLFLFLLKL